MTEFTLTINRGDDLPFTGTWRDATNAAMNMTGWSIAVFEPHPSIDGFVTVQWADAAQGTFQARIEWDDGFPNGKVASFRLRASKDGDDRSSPKIWVVVE